MEIPLFLDPVAASRIQFALTAIVHIIFPVISMGLAPFLVYFTWKEIRTHQEIYVQLRKFWLKIFAVTFVVGTVTGLVLEFEFGTNFAAFSTASGEILGGPLAVEGMMAFFLEATFLGIFVFGRERVSDAVYFLSAVLVALGSWLSAVWILIANSWMQNPRGYELVTRNGADVVQLVDPVAAYWNPRFHWMFVHMQNSAVLSVSLLMLGVSAYHVRKGNDTEFWKKTFKVALVVLAVTAPFQALHGDAYARHIYETQPQKFAAMEAVWETDTYVPEYIVAFPTNLNDLLDPRAKQIFGFGIPGGASWLAGYDPQTTIRGLNEFEGSPPVAIVFWSFRAMVAMGFWFIVLGFWGIYRWWTGELFRDRLYHQSLMLSGGMGILAVELGWIVTEVGRQPWTVTGVMKTTDAVTPSLTSGEATLTLLGFVLAYTAILAVYLYVVQRIVAAGPPDVELKEGEES